MVSTYLRLTPAMRATLGVLLDAPGSVWGLQVSVATGFPTGTIYPLLERLERVQYVTSAWEEERGRRGARRRLYVLTTTGREWANSALGRHETGMKPQEGETA